MSEVEVTGVLMSMLDRITGNSNQRGGTDTHRPEDVSLGNSQLQLSESSTDSGGTVLEAKRCQAVQVWVCSHCPKKFRNFSSLRQHAAFHSHLRPFVCNHESGCTKAYKSKSELNRHAVSHTNTRNFECNVCNKKFLRKQYLKNHLQKHSHESADAHLFRCKWTGCSKIYLNESEVDCHLLTYHIRRSKSKSVESATDGNACES